MGDLERAAAVGAATAVSVPTIATAHMLTSGQSPTPGVLALAAVAALAAAWLGCVALAAFAPAGHRSRWTTMLTTGAALLAGHGVLAAVAGGSAAAGGEGCLPAIGRGAQVGLRLALLRPEAACPTGTLSPGPAAAVLAPILLALAILAGHALTALAAGLLAGMAQAAVAAADLIRRAVPVLLLGRLAPAVPDSVTGRSSRRIAVRRVPRPRKPALTMHPVRRGPPLVLPTP